MAPPAARALARALRGAAEIVYDDDDNRAERSSG